MAGSIRNRKARRNSRLQERDLNAYAFLAPDLVDLQTLTRSIRIARRWQTRPQAVLAAFGWLARDRYAAALAAHLGLPLGSEGQELRDDEIPLDAGAFRPDEVAVIARFEQAAGRRPILSSSAGYSSSNALDDEAAIERATNALKRQRPGQSAATPVWLWQKLAIVVLFGLLVGGGAVMPAETSAIVLAFLAFPFVLVTVLRTMALLELCRPRLQSIRQLVIASDSDLPNYSVLVPLYDEADVLPDLIAALVAIDYPVSKLEILIIVEAGDAKTRASLARGALPPHFSIVVVPPGQPRTKPRALNFALQGARGDFVVVYDAEDVPEPDQLRRAYAALSQRPETLGCVQAKLNIYNPGASWLARQFTIEYSALFDGLLPTLERFRLPVPLGGTSNHFPRALLEAVGGWDPYNVTEDADLGIRLARRGWSVGILDSTTWEEAPVKLRDWKNQRTRWLKGWMQTLLVHTRQPGKLMTEIGEIQFMSLLALLGGLILSALVHPWFYLLIAFEAWRGELLGFPDSLLAQSFWGLAVLNLVVGYSVAMLLGVAAAARRGHLSLIAHVVLLPFYWLAISFSAYRALFQLMHDPFLWEKTPHARRSGPRQGPTGKTPG